MPSRFGYEQDLCDALTPRLTELVASPGQHPMAILERRPVGQVIPDLLVISGPMRNEQLHVRNLSFLDAEIISTLLAGGPLRAATISARIYAAHHQVQARIDKLTRAGLVAERKTGSYEVTLSLGQPHFRVVAVEAKLTRWREAITQAAAYRRFANSAYVALPHEVVTASTALRSEAAKAHIGVIAVSPESSEVILPAPSATLRSASWVWLISRTVGMPSNDTIGPSTC